MADPASQIAACATCGTRLPRAEMFGVEPDLQCPPCAQGIRERLRTRTGAVEFVPRQAATIACLAIAGALFVATHLIYANKPDPAWLAFLYPDAGIWTGELWRHLTSMFLHVDVFHILLNGLALWMLGRIVEGAFSTPIFLLVFLGTGLVGGALGWIFSGPGVGLSGGIFGLAGFLWGLQNKHPIARIVMNERFKRMLIAWLVLGIVLSWSGTMRIGNWAHGGGMAMGFVFAWAWAQPARRRTLALAGSTVAALLVAVASMFVVFGSQPDYVYDTRSGEWTLRGETPRAELRERHLERERAGD